MTNGIGNPDWQRRYVTSAVPLVVSVFPDSGDFVTGINDSNGYQYLLLTETDPSGATYRRIKVDWFQDNAATLQMGSTTFTVPPNAFIVFKVPVVTRWYKVEVGPVGGTPGHNTTVTIYGTNADQENLLTQNTDQPLGSQNASVAAGATQTVIISGVFGGPAMITMDDNVNNKWTEWLEYYDWSTQTWIQFWSAHGTDKGQAWTEMVYLPYAPIRMNSRNDDTVAHILRQYLVSL